MSEADLPFHARARAAVSELGDDIDPSAFDVSFSLFRASTRLIHHLEAEVHRPLGHSIAGFRVMFVVWVHDELEQRRIATLSGVTRAAVSSTLTTLERDGLCERHRAADDRRQIVVRLTDSGRQRVEEAYRRQNEVEVAWLGEFTAADRTETTARLVRLLTASLPDAAAKPVAGHDHG